MPPASYRNPIPTVDVIIEVDGGVVLVLRKNPPHGWALPGGYVEYGERVEDAARREALEETGLTILGLSLLGVYSDPNRDPRQHNLSTTFYGIAEGTPVADDDALEARVFQPREIPGDLVCDHNKILSDYFRLKRHGVRPM